MLLHYTLAVNLLRRGSVRQHWLDATSIPTQDLHGWKVLNLAAPVPPQVFSLSWAQQAEPQAYTSRLRSHFAGEYPDERGMV